MSEVAAGDASIGSTKRPMGWFSFLRWGIGLVLIALLVHPVLFAWVFVEIRGMPQRKTMLLLGAGIVACFVVTYGLFRPAGRRGWQSMGLLSLAAVWIGTAIALAPRLLDENVGDPAELGRFFGICTLAVPMISWLGAWSWPWIVRLVSVMVLAGGFLLFNQQARIDGLSGDETKVSMAWRRGATEPVTSAEPLKVVSGAYPQYLGPHRNARLDDVEIDMDWEKSPPSRVWQWKFEGGLERLSFPKMRLLSR